MQKFLIVGLGNIGDKYVETRHNIGFKAVEHWASHKQQRFESTNFGWMARTRHRGRMVLLLKPDTYMNLSGLAVKFWLNKEKIDLNNLLVITDDLNLPFEKIRIKPKGSAGGHNGLKSIEENLNSHLYPRMRLGVGKNFSSGEQVDYVLGNWSEQENEKLPLLLARTTDAIESFVFEGIDKAMNRFN